MTPPSELTKIKAILMDLAAEIAGLKEKVSSNFNASQWFQEISDAINEIKDE